MSLEFPEPNPRPVPGYEQRVAELLDLAHLLICNAKAINTRDQESWFDAKERWLSNFDIHMAQL